VHLDDLGKFLLFDDLSTAVFRARAPVKPRHLVVHGDRVTIKLKFIEPKFPNLNFHRFNLDFGQTVSLKLFTVNLKIWAAHDKALTSVSQSVETRHSPKDGIAS
jgi:hypothetical protein